MNVTSVDGLIPAAPGYDHGWFGFSPLPRRSSPSLPGGARIAVSVVLDVQAVEWELPGTEPAVAPLGGRRHAPPPDYPRMSHREFGHRVGVFRLLELLAAVGVPLAAALDVLTAEHYPALLAHLIPAADEVVAGGLSGSRPITSRMAEDEERDYINATMTRLESAIGKRPIGWVGPERGESHRTPGLLAAAGVRYVADWGNDEQPHPMDGAAGLWSFPLSWELSDVNTGQLREVTPPTYARSILEAADVMAGDEGTGPRVLGLHLQPWSAGQAHRTKALREALEGLRRRDDIWWATPYEIVAHWRDAATSGGAGCD